MSTINTDPNKSSCPSNYQLQDYFEGNKSNKILDLHINNCPKCLYYLKQLYNLDQKIKDFYLPSLKDNPTQTQINNTMNKIYEASNSISQQIPQFKKFLKNFKYNSLSYAYLYLSLAIIIFICLFFSIFPQNNSNLFTNNKIYQPLHQENLENLYSQNSQNTLIRSNYNRIINSTNSYNYYILVEESLLNKALTHNQLDEFIYNDKTKKYHLIQGNVYKLSNLISYETTLEFEIISEDTNIAKFLANQNAEFIYSKNELSIYNGLFEFEFFIPNSNFIVKTPHCEIYNIGTCYKVNVSSKFSKVIVVKGKVKFKNLFTLEENILESGQMVYIDKINQSILNVSTNTFTLDNNILINSNSHYYNNKSIQNNIADKATYIYNPKNNVININISSSTLQNSNNMATYSLSDTLSTYTYKYIISTQTIPSSSISESLHDSF